MVVHLLQEELQKKLPSTQMLEEVEAEVEEADLEAIRIYSKLKKTSPMQEDVVTLEAGGAKEVVVDGKEAKMQIAMLNATTVVKCVYKNQNDIMNGKLQQGNYASSSRQGDDRNEHLFMVRHMTNSVTCRRKQRCVVC